MLISPSEFLQRALALPPTLGALLFLLFSSEPAHAFGRKPVVVPPPQPSIPSQPSKPEDVIRARWEAKARDGIAWSQHVYDKLPTLAPNLLARDPNDVAEFCPAYSNLDVGDKKNFWVYLVSAVTELESNFNPETIYKEAFYDSKGNRVLSIGLLQLSLSDAAIYGCEFQSNEDIKDPAKNLDCGLRILNKWVGKDQRLAGKNGLAWAGGSRYWSTLRAPKVNQIKAWTNALRMCAN